MGRIIENKLVGFRCQLKSCSANARTLPVPSDTVWIEQITELQLLVADGWAVVLTPRMRTFCPDHSSLVYDCTCKTHPSRMHLCVQHNEAVFDLVWTPWKVPQEVIQELNRHA